MRETANNIGSIEQLAQAIHDKSHQSNVKYEFIVLLIQRIFQVICGYEDANDAYDLKLSEMRRLQCILRYGLGRIEKFQRFR